MPNVSYTHPLEESTLEPFELALIRIIILIFFFQFNYAFAQEEDVALFYSLTQSLITKLDSGNYDEVRSDLLELDLIIPGFKSNWNYGNTIHKMNIARGRLALGDNNIELAKQYLIKAGRAPDSPHLSSFGPNMSLAKELLEKGEILIVLNYFDLCSIFWDDKFSKLNEWRKDIDEGNLPDFGANLYY